MAKTPHKYASVIKAWADGEEIQFRGVSSGNWTNISDEDKVDFNNPYFEWRIKPERFSGKFRVAFCRGMHGFSDYNIYIIHEGLAADAEQGELFVQWLTDWVEFNVEVPTQSN